MYYQFPLGSYEEAVGTKLDSDDLGSIVEVYYTYEVNDYLSITPGIAFTLPTQSAANIAAGSDVLAYYLYDRTAIGIGATFEF